MEITATTVKALREKTGCGMMDCKKALVETNGDMDKAIEFLRERGLAVAAKKAGRIAAEGLVECYINGEDGAIIEVNSETDFVAKNDDFKNFVKGCAITVAENSPADVEALLNVKYHGDTHTVAEVLREKILSIGENLVIRRFTKTSGKLVSYIHGGGRIGVMLNFETDLPLSDKLTEAGKDICMQIAAMNPGYLDKDSVPAEVLEKEKEILIAQIKNDEKNKNKPDAIVEKMVSGRIGKFYEQNCLLHQAFVKDGNISVAKYLEDVSKELGGNIAIKEFIRLEKGEGLQKREDNFAEEIANLVK